MNNLNSRNIKISKHLYDFVKKKIDFAEFLETEVGCKLKWYQQGVSAGTSCPIHSEKKPSFRIKYLEGDELWIFHCLGCGIKGTVIDFCMNYYNLNSSAEAVVYLCNKFDLVKDKEFLSSSFKNIKKKSDLNKKMEYAHILVSDQCRSLLRKDYNKHNQWVAHVYRKMNRALDNDDIQTIENIGNEAFIRMKGNLNVNGCPA